MGDSNLTVKDLAEDVRGRKVLDKEGKEIGSVDDLLIDERESKVRFLHVESGGFLGLGQTKVLIPIDAITKITPDAVQVDHTLAHIAGGPRYHPALITDAAYWDSIYSHYGDSPYWSLGYMYPAYPWY